ncbi:Na+/H+ antiporter subunit E [Mesorhizobium sp. 8]|uniref:Na+/H+ antiporter subunit E n=1 Tax=Mesorhizobium sp. 8 TaxID=2584466 RepID=UPI0011212FFA|nr:Na+/H+ antiporter subunit E [Mesorhizobium sp. 8]QDC00440.1 Na+/H+ antiporter subunit E [Mesorhizobium sp. 8]
MRWLLPYPLLTLALALMWLLLSGVSPGQVVLAAGVATGASHALAALGETSPTIRRWLAIPELFGIVLYDIVRSNIAVAGILLGLGSARKAGFVTVPLTTRSPSALAILSIIVTSTPGTAWIDYDAARNEVLVHVFDLVDEAHWRQLIAERYERLLMEIFE